MARQCSPATIVAGRTWSWLRPATLSLPTESQTRCSSRFFRTFVPTTLLICSLVSHFPAPVNPVVCADGSPPGSASCWWGPVRSCSPNENASSRWRHVMRSPRCTTRARPALRIGLHHLLKYLLRLTIPERVLVAHSPIEPPLRRLVTRRREMDIAKALISFILARRT